MDWQVLQDGMKTLLAAASGLSVHNLAWDGEPETMRGFPMAQLEWLRPGNDRSTDETRYDPDPDDDGSLVPYIVGNRTVTLQITVKSRDHRGPTKAFAILERLRTRLELPQHQAQLDELEVALRDSAPTVDLNKVSQQREESIAQLTLRLGYTVEERDDEHPEQTVERVEVSGEIVESGQTITTPETTLVYDGDDEALTLG